MKQENTEQSDFESPNPKRDAIWAKHYSLTPALCEEMLDFAGKMEQDRNMWKHNAKVAEEVAIDAVRALMMIQQHAQCGEEYKSYAIAQDFFNQSNAGNRIRTAISQPHLDGHQKAHTQSN